LLDPSNYEIIVDDTTPTFYWSNVTNAVRYQLQIDDFSSFSSPAFDNDNITSTSRQINISLGQGVYYWRVRAINTYDTEGTWSSVRRFTISISPGVVTLYSPTNGFTWTNAYSYLTFSWSSVYCATSYEIQIDDNSSFYNPEIEQTVYSTSKAIYRTQLDPACPGDGTYYENYYWRVRAVNTYGTTWVMHWV